MVSKKITIISSFVLLIISAIFVSPTLTGNAIGPLTKNTSSMIGGLFIFLLGITISLSLKKK